MAQLQDQIRRIIERLSQLRAGYQTHSERSLSELSEAIGEVTEAVRQIEQRLQKLETDQAR